MTPTQDMVIGAYYLTELVAGAKGEGRIFRHTWEVYRALDEGDLSLHAQITLRRAPRTPTAAARSATTTAGRVLFEEALPADYIDALRLHQRDGASKRDMGSIVEHLAENYRKAEVAEALDGIKNLCYRYAAQSGLTISIDDVKTPDGEEGDPRQVREGSREGRDAVPAGHHHRRRAPPAGGPHLDRGHRPGPGGHGEGPQAPSSSTPST